MSQNSREIVEAALRFGRPDRLPVQIPSAGIADCAGIPLRGKGREENGARIDEWDCVWEQTHVKNTGQVTGHPLDGSADHEKIVAPDYSEDWRYEGAEEALEAAEEAGRYTQVGFFMVLFERMHSLAGFEKVLSDLLEDRPSAEALADRIVDTHLGLVRGVQERFGDRVHSFLMTDDWGTQTAAFISTELWYDFFFPRYKRLFDAMHEGGQTAWLHSCGKINELIQGFIDAGVDVMNLMQPRALGIEEIGRRYRGKVALMSLPDIQATLPTGDGERIKADARDLADHWMMPEGGFILTDYGDNAAIGAAPNSGKLIYEAFNEISREVYGNPLPEPTFANAG